MKRNLIQATEISRRYTMGDYTVNALNNINLTVQEGEFIAITGSSGSGKSTLMNIIGLLDSSDSGPYLFCGKNVRELSDRELSIIRNEKIGFIFQSYNLIPTLSILENVALPLAYRGMPCAERYSRAVSALKAVDLSHRISHRPCELSGGQQQRAAIARVIASDPELILADEPCGSLDSSCAKDIMELLKNRQKSGSTVILITHDLSDTAYADRVLTVHDGKLTGNNF